MAQGINAIVRKFEVLLFDDANGFPDGLLLAGGRVKDSIFAEYLELARAIGFCVELAVRRDVRELFIIDAHGDLLFE